MARMSKAMRKRFFAKLVERDGPYCYYGGEEGDEKTLLIDHADNCNFHNALTNLHLACRTINAMKNCRGPSKKKQSIERVRGAVSTIDSQSAQPQSAEFRKNQQAEPDFKHWLFIEVWRKGMIVLEEAINCGAAMAHCSQQVIKRYLDKETCRLRPYEIIEIPSTQEKYIRFRPQWEECRKKEEARRILLKQAANWRREGSGDLCSSTTIGDVKKAKDSSAKKDDKKTNSDSTNNPAGPSKELSVRGPMDPKIPLDSSAI